MSRLSPEELDDAIGDLFERETKLVKGHIAAIEADLAEANRCREFGYQECVSHLIERDQALAENRRLREALAFYADPESYVLKEREGMAYQMDIDSDQGDKARAALEAK